MNHCTLHTLLFLSIFSFSSAFAMRVIISTPTPDEIIAAQIKQANAKRNIHDLPIDKKVALDNQIEILGYAYSVARWKLEHGTPDTFPLSDHLFRTKAYCRKIPLDIYKSRAIAYINSNFEHETDYEEFMRRVLM